MTSIQTCPKCGVGNFLTTEINGEITKRRYSCGHNEIIVVKNESINISENTPIILEMTFELYDSVKVGGKITNSDNIEFIMDPEHPDSVRKFIIKLTNPSQQKEREALQVASEITNYLSVIANRPVKHKLPIIRRTNKGKTTAAISFGVGAFLHKNFDLDANLLDSKLLNKNPDLNKRLQLYNDGLKEIDNNDFGGAIQSFYQCIENTNVPERSDYLPLRDAASHQRIDDPSKIAKLNSVGIIMRVGESLNENDPDNQHILKSKAYDLKQIAWKYLNDKITSL